MFKNLLKPVALLLFFTISISAHSAEISGTVFNAETDQIIQNANILLGNGEIGDVTDSEGAFVFTGLNHGLSYLISASHIGFHITKVDVAAGENVRIYLKPMILKNEDVVFSTSRIKTGITPVSFSNIDGNKIRENYYAQDIPPLLESMPGVISHSETGMNIGYTHLKIRGFDQKRIGVTINNIPLNDPEDGEVYWVNTPDFASSIQDIQLQRGVGFSPFGAGGFGGSLNLITKTPGLEEPGMEVEMGAGSYNTRKLSTSYNAGLIKNTYGFYGRFSQIQTDGYRDRSGADLWSYFLSGSRYGKNNLLSFNVYGGQEETHAAWNASSEADIEQNRRHNPYTYENTLDHFLQPHYEIHHKWWYSDKVTVENSFFYIRGEGYYEQFKDDKDVIDFGYQPGYVINGDTISSTDFINQKWVTKDHYGWIPRISLKHNNGELKLGGDIQFFGSDHYGYVLWGRDLPVTATPRDKYYQYKGQIQQGGLFVHELYHASDRLNIIADAELRYRFYSFEQQEVANFNADQINKFDTDYLFLNPKLGASYSLKENTHLFVSAGISHRAPSDHEYWNDWDAPDDFGVDPLFAKNDTIRSNGTIDYIEWSDPQVDPERVINFEVGCSFNEGPFRVKADAYWMDFKNEIINSGGVNDDGLPVKDNADRSVHRGLELEIEWQPGNGLFVWGNTSFSYDKLTDYKTYEMDWDLMQASEIDLSDNRIALFPGYVFSGGVGYSHRIISAQLDTRLIGRQYLDNTEDDNRSIDPYTLVGATLNYRLPDTLPLAKWVLSFRVNNLFNTEYETSGYYDPWNGGNQYFVGSDRNVFVRLIANL